MRKKAKILSVVFALMAVMTLCTNNVYAYIDPSVMTYAIQAIAGIVIAIGAFLGIYFRKIKKNVSDKLGIDENRNKEVESDDIEIIKEDK